MELEDQALEALSGIADELRANARNFDIWFEDKRISMRTEEYVRHCRTVGQPITEEGANLWFARLAKRFCPVSDACKRPKKGQTYCTHHAKLLESLRR